MSEKKERKPQWLRRMVRERMKETGEKYTVALRAVEEEHKRRAYAERGRE